MWLSIHKENAKSTSFVAEIHVNTCVLTRAKLLNTAKATKNKCLVSHLCIHLF